MIVAFEGEKPCSDGRRAQTSDPYNLPPKKLSPAHPDSIYTEAEVDAGCSKHSMTQVLQSEALIRFDTDVMEGLTASGQAVSGYYIELTPDN
jgi:hypothetical protein